jgi:hypothetical protein
MKQIILRTIILYQKLISPLFRYIRPHRGCRFYPNCSKYSYQAIEKYGLLRGLIKSFKRIIKCHPFSRGGHDPC